jgi:acyl carrier protein
VRFKGKTRELSHEQGIHDYPDFEGRVIEIIVKQAGELRGKQVVPGSSLENLGFDSFDAVSLMFALEDEFHVEIPDEKVRGLTTVSDIVAELRQLCAAQRPSS